MELGHFDKPFVKNTRKKAPQGKILEVFLLVTLKTRFSMEDSSQGWTQLGPFFPKSGYFFRIPHPPSPPAPLSCGPVYQYLFRISSLKRVDLTKTVNSFPSVKYSISIPLENIKEACGIEMKLAWKGLSISIISKIIY